MLPAAQSEVTVQTDGRAGAGGNSRPAGEAENGGLQPVSHSAESGLQRFYPGLDLSRREGAGRLPRLGSSAEACKAHGLVLSNHILLASASPQLPGILAMVRVGFSRRWRAVNARVCGAPALFSLL